MISNAITSLLFVLIYNHFQLIVYGKIDSDRVGKLREILEGVTVDEDKASVVIDKDHLKSNPECGYLPSKTKNAHGSSRIANAEESDQHYPWTILITNNNAVQTSGECGGAIISQTVAITAAHCICGSSKTPSHLKQYTECKRGGNRNAKNPLNEIRRKEDTFYYREIIAGVGGKDKRRLIKIDILIAYVMGDTFEEINAGAGIRFDIGLVITKDKSGNGKRFYTHMIPQGDIKVGSLCLATKKTTAPHMYEGKIVTVGWGVRYSEVTDPTNFILPQANNHSCTTNEFGPPSAAFKHCNVDHVFWNNRMFDGCRRKEMPTGYDLQKCDEYFQKAEKAIEREVRKMSDSTISDLWTLTNKFEIIPFKKRNIIGISSEIKTICYKPRLFSDLGWCYVDDDKGQRTDQWGFCGPSCDFLGNFGSSIPNIYHKMVWEFPPNPPAGCKIPVIPSHDSRHFKPWYICIVSRAPSTSIFQFKENLFGTLNFRSADKEDSAKSGYQLPCFGDSGSGHFMHETNEDKWALVAINSYQEGEYCGFDEHAITTVHPRVLDWIKLHSHISKSP